MTLLMLIVWLLIIGFVAWLISTAPFIDATFKGIIKWLLIVAASVLVIVFLIGLIHGNTGNVLDLR